MFRSVSNSASGEVGAETVFHYHQDGTLDMRYQHINADGRLMTGTCISTPEVLGDGRLRLHEKWRWTSGDASAGESVIEEVTGQVQP